MFKGIYFVIDDRFVGNGWKRRFVCMNKLKIIVVLLKVLVVLGYFWIEVWVGCFLMENGIFFVDIWIFVILGFMKFNVGGDWLIWVLRKFSLKEFFWYVVDFYILGLKMCWLFVEM